MKALQPATRGPRGDAEVGTVVDALFARWPALLGFSVQEEGELYLNDVAIHPWFEEYRSNLCYDIAMAFSELIDEEPEARERLSGRTFARNVH